MVATRFTEKVNNALPIMTSISENKIFWKTCVRKKDFDATSEFNGMTYDQIVNCLDTDCVSKEILWKALKKPHCSMIQIMIGFMKFSD